jgi:argininosuccinate lyase
MKGQPLAYNKDNQEDKEPLFDTVDTLVDTLTIFAEMVAGMKVKPARMREATLEGYATATDLADALVKKGMPFRDAHEAVARAVRYCDDHGKGLEALSVHELQTALHLTELGYSDDLVNEALLSVLTLEGSLAARNHIGGTAPNQVRLAIAATRQRLGLGAA